MDTTDPRIDAYIRKAPEFARPILEHFRSLVHEADPEATETLKWGHPAFMHGGILCGMAAFKAHCAFHFWKGSLIVDLKHGTADEAMGQFGRVTRIADLPSKSVLKGYVKKAVQLNEAGVKPARPKRAPRPPAAVPDDLAAALRRNQAARKTFEGFSPSQQREYVEWITEARREETRKSRLATTLEWLAEGKQRNWKYQ
ncbi:MAG TPA: YdeI/OmpD-associated family protein [Gemmatimonadales bacterium]|jgi:uncharacterized protein YdeI (YjbR/CyaY-like superfamily)|nr:YdeI/OmpD-associated family protein [Gemmatimonadales bacterium]